MGETARVEVDAQPARGSAVGCEVETDAALLSSGLLTNRTSAARPAALGDACVAELLRANV